MHAFTHIRIHAARTAELAAEAAEWHLAHKSAPTAPTAPALRDRLGEVLVAAGIRLMQPAHVHARIHQRTT
ncbi:hypothetical protein [Streptomyces sp. NPDC051183]|uniref:hypothetical protein n=1 Tax=Streptomyces sp. NPDC051183 TaxID=3155165 RepID=UPI003414F698